VVAGADADAASPCAFCVAPHFPLNPEPPACGIAGRGTGHVFRVRVWGAILKAQPSVMQPATLVNLPDASSTLHTLAGFSSPVFDTVLPFSMTLVGIFLGGFLLHVFAGKIVDAVTWVFSPSERVRRSRLDTGLVTYDDRHTQFFFVNPRKNKNHPY